MDTARSGPLAPGHLMPSAAELIDQIERLSAHAEKLELQIRALKNPEQDHQRRLEDFASTTRGWFWETDASLRFRYLSPGVLDIIGVSAEWHYGKTRYEFGAPESVPKEVWELHLGQLERLEPFKDFIYRRPCPKGDRWLKVSGRPYFDRKGRFLGYRGSAIDISEEHETKKNADILFAAVENYTEPCVLWDANDTLVLGNRRFREVTTQFADVARPGTRFEDHVRAIVAAGFVPDAAADPEAWIEFRLDQFRNPGEAFEVTRPDGSCILLRDYKLPDGATITTSTDITARKRAETLLEQKTEILEAALRTIPDGVQVLDDDLNLLAWNEELFEVMEVDRDAVLNSDRPGWAFFEFIAKRGDYGTGEIDDLVESRLGPLRDKRPVCFERQLLSGKWVECRGGPVKDGGYVAVYRDIDDSKRMTERLKDLATVDELTGLYNRRHFLDIATTELQRSRRYGRPLVFLMLDLDRFKTINDSHGHSAGDQVLRVFAATCTGMIRESDQMGRLGGEEFAIMLPETDTREARKLAKRLRKAIGSKVVEIEGEKIRITSSFGLAAVDDHHKSLENVLDDADKALYEAKRTGRNKVVDSTELT